ncbi:GNAT family N-acetyltransferase [Microbacterium hominis]|uniref:GNAT family N-acetyltransferase n=1 Tax=Microbacterium hominis TaxID=162426 RepID=A0A7D4UI98_9MICO|nr:GNAT family N-acetyltransferase [Microbacterium hominis]QKJ19488.1 GNAT family N-acetyltransferase [Microbacterium hominis]
MTAPVAVRRVRLHEWEQVRALRVEAVGDPDAAIAFLSTREDELARDEAFWRERAAGAALGENAAQFVAVEGERWVGTATVLLREAGERDHLGRELSASRADVVGVYIAPDHRGTGVLGLLMGAARTWAADRGHGALTLDVHVENIRAQSAYRKAGFAPTGVTFTSVIGPELEMRSTSAGSSGQ